MTRLVKAVVSLGFIGYFPFWPGTLASAVTALAAWSCPWSLAAPVVIFSFIGFTLCKPAQKIFGVPDPGRFVLDEACGMTLSLLWLPKSVWIYCLAFIFFRIFDALKPWPISCIQRSPNPMSIVWDDLAAGFFSNILLQILSRFVI